MIIVEKIMKFDFCFSLEYIINVMPYHALRLIPLPSIALPSTRTAGFFAPEMIICGSYEGDKADVWSIGCILLELLFGHRRYVLGTMISLSLAPHKRAVDVEENRYSLYSLTSVPCPYEFH